MTTVMQPFPQEPVTREEILAALESVEREVATFFGDLSEGEFFTRVDEAWNPAEHLGHLNTSVAAVAKGLTIPRLVLWLRFGAARAPSRSYGRLRETYLEGLRSGVRASGVFVPPRTDPAPDQGATRAELIARWGRVNARLETGVRRWSEPQLDRLRMPHPALGLLTVREMLFFTIYHNLHHVAAAKRRLKRFALDPGEAE